MKTCRAGKEGESPCARARPEVIVVICADRVYDEVFDKLGRGALILRVPGPKLPDVEQLKDIIDGFEPAAAEIYEAMLTRGKSLLAPLIPDRNFQRMTNQSIARDVQANPLNFR